MFSIPYHTPPSNGSKAAPLLNFDVIGVRSQECGGINAAMSQRGAGVHDDSLAGIPGHDSHTNLDSLLGAS